MDARHPKKLVVANDWDRIRDLYNKLLHWLYAQEDVSKAQRCAHRLERLLTLADPAHETIFGQECWSLIYEASGNLQKAIEHRKKEIELIQRLQAISHNQPYEAVAVKDYGPSDLSDRLNLLATLYHDSRDLRNAISTLEESKQLCTNSAITFDGEDLLRDYRNEQPTATI